MVNASGMDDTGMRDAQELDDHPPDGIGMPRPVFIISPDPTGSTTARYP
jgi:hypothetical protein